MKLARRLLKEDGLINAKLETVANFYNLKSKQSHRAFGDAEVTAKVFIEFLKLAEKLGIDSVAKFHQFQNLPIKSI